MNIKNYCISENARDFNLIFADGTIVNATDKESPLRTIYGTDGSEYMTSIYADGVTKIGQDGDDQLVGSDGDDYLYGGKGNDYLYGGAGKDTYIFNKGYGMDAIIDSEGVNTISFGNGLPADQLTAYRTNWNDLTITFEGIDDKLIITGYFTSENNRKFNVQFANGLQFAFDDADNPIRWVHATEYDDWMSAWSDDGIILYGDKGNDHLTGGKGNDTLCGGEGTDYLSGGKGNDTYIFGKGYGSDTIEDSDGDNRMVFDELALNKVTFQTKVNGNLVISVKGSDDTLTIKNYSPNLYIFEFADGVTGTVSMDTGEFTVIY